MIRHTIVTDAMTNEIKVLARSGVIGFFGKLGCTVRGLQKGEVLEARRHGKTKAKDWYEFRRMMWKWHSIGLPERVIEVEDEIVEAA